MCAAASVPSAAAAAAAKVVNGCGKPATPGLTTVHLRVGGDDREYLQSIPPSYDPSKPAPLILNFHGFSSNMHQQALYSRMNEKAGAKGYVVLTPNGSGRLLLRWSFPPLPGSDADLAFVKAMLARTQRGLCLDTKRIFATGISNGAIFSTALVCELRGQLAAIAPVAGVNVTRPCADGSPPTAVIAFHGTADPLVPYHGGAYFSGVRAFSGSLGAQGRGPGRVQARPVDDAVADWARFDGCGTPASTTAVAPDVDHVVSPGCPPSGAVELYRVVGGGHTWPGAVPVGRLGPTTSSIDATALMLDFFAAHPRAG